MVHPKVPNLDGRDWMKSQSVVTDVWAMKPRRYSVASSDKPRSERFTEDAHINFEALLC